MDGDSSTTMPHGDLPVVSIGDLKSWEAMLPRILVLTRLKSSDEDIIVQEYIYICGSRPLRITSKKFVNEILLCRKRDAVLEACKDEEVSLLPVLAREASWLVRAVGEQLLRQDFTPEPNSSSDCKLAHGLLLPIALLCGVFSSFQVLFSPLFVCQSQKCRMV